MMQRHYLQEQFRRGNATSHRQCRATAFLKKQDADAATGAPPPAVEIVVGEVTIRVGADVSEAALRRILRAAREA